MRRCPTAGAAGRGGVPAGVCERAKHRAVGLGAEAPGSLVHGQPPPRVGLWAGQERAAGAPHGSVGHHLVRCPKAGGDRVSHGGEAGSNTWAVPGFFCHFPQGCHQEMFSTLGLALRQGPVVIFWSVHQGHFRVQTIVPPENSPCGEHGGAAHWSIIRNDRGRIAAISNRLSSAAGSARVALVMMGDTIASASERRSATRPTPVWSCVTWCSPRHGEPVVNAPPASRHPHYSRARQRVDTHGPRQIPVMVVNSGEVSTGPGRYESPGPQVPRPEPSGQGITAAEARPSPGPSAIFTATRATTLAEEPRRWPGNQHRHTARCTPWSEKPPDQIIRPDRRLPPGVGPRPGPP